MIKSLTGPVPFLVLVTTFTLLGAGVSALVVQQSAVAETTARLNAILPEKVQRAEINSLDDPAIRDFLVERLNSDLAALPVANMFTRACSSRVQEIDGLTLGDPGGRAIDVSWRAPDRLRHIKLAFSCELNQPVLWGSQLLLALLAVGVMTVLPRPVTASREKMQADLLAAGCDKLLISKVLADPEVTGLDSAQWDWLNWALHTGRPFAEALTIARAQPALEFEPAVSTIRIRGVAVEMPATPFLYYYFYASQRLRAGAADDVDGGWFTNPPSNRPDRDAARILIDMMTAYGGHQRAINDLAEKGLRAKILDQNRSKIKDELVGEFGDELAAPYLFDMVRDGSTARYRYRLRVSPDLIHL
jgi:hypothetical protein